MGKLLAPLDIAERVRRFRMSSRLTQEELAQTAKLTPKFVSQIENGHVNPSIAVLARLVQDGLRMSLAAFFATDGDHAVHEDVSALTALLAVQPPEVRRLALRVLHALCDGHGDVSSRPRRRARR